MRGKPKPGLKHQTHPRAQAQRPSSFKLCVADLSCGDQTAKHMLLIETEHNTFPIILVQTDACERAGLPKEASARRHRRVSHATSKKNARLSYNRRVFLSLSICYRKMINSQNKVHRKYSAPLDGTCRGKPASETTLYQQRSSVEAPLYRDLVTNPRLYRFLARSP